MNARHYAQSYYSVVSLAKLRLQGAWRVEMLHSSDKNRLYWITRGQGRVMLNCVTRGYGPNSVVFVPAGTAMAFELTPQAQGFEISLPHDASLLLPDLAVQLRVSAMDAQLTLTSLIERFEAELGADDLEKGRALQAHAVLISVWLNRALNSSDFDETGLRRHRLVELFSDRLEAMYRTGMSVSDFAAELQVTPTHLSRACREASGRTAHALLNDRLMHEARRLLLDTQMPSNEIAALLGFSSPAYFTRAFSQANAMPPGKFRKSGARGPVEG